MDVEEDLHRLRQKIANVHPEELAVLASAAGWDARTGGKHRWILQKRGRRPIVIPDHPGTLTPRIVRMVLNQIEAALEDERPPE